jgi:ubiquinol-cytochrome c reductase cytochrome c subunit
MSFIGTYKSRRCEQVWSHWFVFAGKRHFRPLAALNEHKTRRLRSIRSLGCPSGWLEPEEAALRFPDRRLSVSQEAFIARALFGLLAFIFLASQTALGQQPEPGSSPNGSAVYLKRCSTCHGTAGQGISGVISIAGPSLQAEHDRRTVVNMVRSGKGIMPSFKHLLPEEDIDSVADYVTQQLATIPLQGGDLSEGGALFRVYCAPCHGTAARGGAMASAGINAPSLVGKSAATIAGTIRWGPGPMPKFPSSAISDQELDSIVMYVQFMQHPPSPGGTPMRYYGSVAEGFVAWIAVFLLVATAGWIEKRGKG